MSQIESIATVFGDKCLKEEGAGTMSETAIALGGIRTRASLRPLLVVSLVVAGLLLVVFAHIKVAQAGDDYTGGLAPLDRVFDISFALLLVGISFCVGRGIAGRLSLEFASLAEEVSFSVMVGVGTTGSLVMGLGLVGGLTPVPVAGLFLVLIALSRREASRLVGVVGEGLRATMQTRTRRIVSAMFVLLVCVLVLRTAAPPHNYDETIYHLSVSRAFVEHGRIYPVYDDWAGNMPFLLHMFYAVCLMVKSDIAAKMFSLFLAVIASLSLYGFCTRFLDRRVGVIAMFAFFGAGMVVEVAVTTRVDVSMAGMLFLAVYAMMIHLETDSLSWLWTSAALAGFGMGIKYPAGFWFAILLFMFLFETLFVRGRSLPATARRAIGFLFIASIIASPWYIKNAVWFHNPVYPLFTGEVSNIEPGKARYFNQEDELRLAAHFDAASAAMPEVVGQLDGALSLAASRHTERHPFRFWEYFTSPNNFNVAEPYHDPNYLFLLSPLFLLFTTRRWLVWLAVFGVLFYVSVAATTWCGRYLLPIYPGLTIMAAYAINEIAVRLKPRAPLTVFLPAVAVGLAVAASLIVCTSRIYALSGVGFIRGAISRREFLFARFYYPSIDFLNHHLLPNDRVMMFGAQMCYDMKRDFIVDISHNSTLWRRVLARNATLDEVNHDLKQQRITHILYTHDQFTFSAELGREGQLIPRPGDKPEYLEQLRNWTIFERYRRSFLESVYADDAGYHLYAIK